MDKYRAIPTGYMTVGELAKKMGVTVRTLQYYDKEGFFSPSAESAGGRRLYTHKDLIKLYQILSLKHLGFSLEDIKNKIIPLDTPAEVAEVLAKQAADIKNKIQNLSQAYEDIMLLQAEVLQIQSVDFKKYADILTNIQMKNEFYWLIKHFDEPVLEHIENHFDQESSMEFANRFKQLCDKIYALQQDNVPPDNEAAQALAKSFWEMAMEFADKDMNILTRLMKLEQINENENLWEGKQATVNTYIKEALDIYFSRIGGPPIPEESEKAKGDIP